MHLGANGINGYSKQRGEEKNVRRADQIPAFHKRETLKPAQLCTGFRVYSSLVNTPASWVCNGNFSFAVIERRGRDEGGVVRTEGSGGRGGRRDLLRGRGGHLHQLGQPHHHQDQQVGTQRSTGHENLKGHVTVRCNI